MILDKRINYRNELLLLNINLNLNITNLYHNLTDKQL